MRKLQDEKEKPDYGQYHHLHILLCTVTRGAAEMMQAICAFLEFCYIAWHDILDTKSVEELEDVLNCYHSH